MTKRNRSQPAVTTRALTATIAVLLTATLVHADKASTTPEASGLSEREALRIAEQAYVFGYPLVTMEMTQRVITNTATPTEKRAPINQFARMRKYPDASFKEVTAPNADTLYQAAFLDLSKEPMILSIPDMGDRYYLFPTLSAWTEVFQVPGSRTTGQKAQKYLISGPGWKGEVPDGVKQYEAPTNMVWIIGRIYSTGTKEDYAAVHKLQDQITLVPLSAYGKPYTPPRGTVDPKIDMKTAVRDQVNELNATDFFTTMAQSMGKNPPMPADTPIIKDMAKIGVVPGKPVDRDKLAKVAGKWDSLMKIKHDMKHAGTKVNGWEVMLATGNYGTKYLQRAFIAAFGLGANRPEDAVYPTSVEDAEGQKYDGSHKYVIHMTREQLPPVKGFWSLTMYDDKYFFVDNPLNRYALSQRNKFTTNPDGSVDLYLQKDDPGGAKTANWLPAPDGTFVLMMRLYWPKEESPSILNGSWKPPPVKRVQ